MAALPPGHHLAAILPSKGGQLKVIPRPTPSPGPNELLVEVKSFAFNPIDWKQRDTGLFINSYPAILGSDIAGIILSVGSSVTAEYFKPGTKVAAYALGAYLGNIDHGALQTRVTVPVHFAVPLPNEITFNEGSLLPMGVATAWTGYYNIGLTRDTKVEGKQGLLVWGGASSVGSSAVQIARNMGFIVYTTASTKHHEYMKTLGASKVFDYKTQDVVEKIVNAANKDCIKIQTVYDAVPGALEQCVEVLKRLKGDGPGKLSSAPQVPQDFPKMDDVEVKFVLPPADPKEITELYKFVFNVWLKEKLITGEFVPSPKVQVIPGGLEAANKTLEELKQGVSGVKLVLEV